jgi:hypothetical protein
MAYLLDANVFIAAKNLHYGLDFCPAFWDWLVERQAEGIKIPDACIGLGISFMTPFQMLRRERAFHSWIGCMKPSWGRNWRINLGARPHSVHRPVSRDAVSCGPVVARRGFIGGSFRSRAASEAVECARGSVPRAKEPSRPWRCLWRFDESSSCRCRGTIRNRISCSGGVRFARHPVYPPLAAVAAGAFVVPAPDWTGHFA